MSSDWDKFYGTTWLVFNIVFAVSFVAFFIGMLCIISYC